MSSEAITKNDLAAILNQVSVAPAGNYIAEDVNGDVSITRNVTAGGDLTAGDIEANSVNIASGESYKINDVALSASDVGAVPTTRTVNGKALSSNISLTASDVGLSTTEPTKPTITKSSGNATASVSGWVAYGNVRMLTIAFTTTASTSAGSDLFNGTITTTAARPKIATSGVSFFGSAATICYIGSNGAIQVRVIGASIASGKNTNAYLTYIV